MLAPLGEIARRVVQGIRFHEGSDRVDVKNTVLSRPRDALVKMNWRIERETKTGVEAVSTETGARVHIPRPVLRPTTRSPAGMDTMEISEPSDFIVIGRFPGDEAFWDDPDPDGVLARRLPHLKSREAFLVAAGRNNVDLAASGTHFLAFVSRQPVPPTWTFWSVQTTTLEDARLLALWWNSTFHLVQLIENRTEVRGSWMGWIRDDLVRLRVLDPTALAPNTRKELLATYDTWKSTRFPSLMEQLRTHFQGRVAIDTALAKALDLPGDRLGLPELYDILASRIESLLSMMARD